MSIKQTLSFTKRKMSELENSTKNSTIQMAEKLQKELSLRFQEVKNTIHQHLPNYEVSKMEVIPLSGLTNQTYKVTHLGLESLVFRKFSDIYDRELENQVFLTLEKSLIAPKCFYASKLYRIERFVENAVHPTIENLREQPTKERVLKLMHKYHQQEISLLRDKPLFVDYFLSKEFDAKVRSHQNDKPNCEKFKKLYTDTIQAYENVDRKLLCPEAPIKGVQDKRVGFCHNDLNNLNIFFEPEVMFIDYEYSSYNFIAYDLANFLNESTIGYDVKEFPGFRHTHNLTLEEIKQTAEFYPETYEGFTTDIIKCLALCNLYWAGWCVSMCNNEASNQLFGTQEHGFLRLRLYEHYKELLIKTK